LYVFQLLSERRDLFVKSTTGLVSVSPGGA
jgi:hypothetical protein